MSRKILAYVLVSGVLLGCSGASDPLVDSCAGTFTCTTGGTSVETTLVRQTNGCFAGEIRLGNDHVATLPSGRQGSWAGSVERFDVCEGSDCVVCTAHAPSAPAIDAAVHTGRCMNGGDAQTFRCGAFDGDVDACKLYGCAVSYGGDGGKMQVCTGDAPKCSSYISSEECVARPDCTWE